MTSRLPAAKMEERDRSQRMRAAPRSWEREGDTWSPGASRETNPADTLIFAWGDPCQTSALQTCEIVSLCCWMPLRGVVTAAVGNTYSPPAPGRSKPRLPRGGDFRVKLAVLFPVSPLHPRQGFLGPPPGTRPCLQCLSQGLASGGGPLRQRASCV